MSVYVYVNKYVKVSKYMNHRDILRVHQYLKGDDENEEEEEEDRIKTCNTERNARNETQQTERRAEGQTEEKGGKLTVQKVRKEYNTGRGR